MKQREFFGRGNISSIRDILEEESARNIFLVTGKESYELSGAEGKLELLLRMYNVTRFNDFNPNPQFHSIEIGYKNFIRDNYDLIVAVGGGSVIDVAKAIKTFYFKDYKQKIPMVAIPTTAGSGSEATHYIVYYRGMEKQSEGESGISIPEYSICDPDFIANLPKKVAASSGIDALSQAIESNWSINSTESSKQFSRKAIRLLIENLEYSIKGHDRDTKSKVMIAANLSGKAIEVTKTTACHSISYPITSYFKVPHGHAVGLTLGEMLTYNYYSKQKCIDQRGEDYLKSTLEEISTLVGGRDVIEAKGVLYNLMNNLGLETKLSNLGVNKEGIDIIIKHGFNPKRVKNNPRHIDEKGLREILENIY